MGKQVTGKDLLLLVETLKSRPQPGLFSELNSFIHNNLSSLLCCPFATTTAASPWKEIANCLTSIPNLYANYSALDKFPHLREASFYERVLTSLYSNLEKLAREVEPLCDDRRFYLTQVVGRISVSGHRELVWRLFSRKALRETNDAVKRVATEILTTPVRQDSSHLFEIFVEHLYVPLFLYSNPADSCESHIESVIGNYIETNEALQYIVCDKLIFKTNYDLNHGQQVRILLNIFNYLALIVKHTDRQDEENVEENLDREESCGDADNRRIATNETLCDQVKSLVLEDKKANRKGRIREERSSSSLEENVDICLLTETFLEIVRNWSNGTKILLRSYAHNKYVSIALILGLRFTIERDQRCLLKQLSEIESTLMKAVAFYLNRSSSELRELAMCVGEVVFPRLHKLSIVGHGNEKGSHNDIGSKTERKLELDFNIKYSASLKRVHRLIDTSVDLLIDAVDEDDNNGQEIERLVSSESTTCASTSSVDRTFINKTSKAASHGLTTGIEPRKQQQQQPATSKSKEGDEDNGNDTRDVDEDNNEDDGEIDDGDEHDSDEMGSGESGKVPIYLRDCVDGLAENNDARYVRLCLIRAGELISQLEQWQEQHADVSTRAQTSTSMGGAGARGAIGRGRGGVGGGLDPNSPPTRSSFNCTMSTTAPSSIAAVATSGCRSSLRLDDLYRISSELSSTSKSASSFKHRRWSSRSVGPDNDNHDEQMYGYSDTRCVGCFLCSPTSIRSVCSFALNAKTTTPTTMSHLDMPQEQATVTIDQKRSRGEETITSSTYTTSASFPSPTSYTKTTAAATTNLRRQQLQNSIYYARTDDCITDENLPIKDNCLELARLLLYLDNQFNIKHFDSYRMRTLCSLCCGQTELVAKFLLDEFNSSNTSISLKLDILNVLVSTATQLSSAQSMALLRNNASSSANAATRQSKVAQKQRFTKYAPLFIYGIVNKLKAELDSANRLLDCNSIVSYRRAQMRCQQTRKTLIEIVPSSSSSPHSPSSCSIPPQSMSSSSSSLATTRPSIVFPKGKTILVEETDKPMDKAEHGANKLAQNINKNINNNNEPELDDSYLLSRILFSISLLVKCLDQQPIMCKLSMDLLDVLNAYTSHLESGVRRSVLSCLIAIKQSTPSVYFEYNLATRFAEMCRTTLANNNFVDAVVDR